MRFITVPLALNNATQQKRQAKHTMKLTAILHDSFLHSGEILPASDIAQIIQEYEFESGTEHDAATILKAIRDAGERFVDSMQENERETENEARNDRLAYWEAMRPSVVRRAELEATINRAAVVTTMNPPLYAHYTVGKQPAVRITPNVRPIEGTVHNVKGKREANALAKAHAAKPWNF